MRVARRRRTGEPMTYVRGATWTVALASLLASGASYDVQDRTSEHPGAPIPDSAPVTVAAADSTCLDLPWPEPRATMSDRLLSMDCRPVESGELSGETERHWRWVRYRRMLVYGPRRDTPAERMNLFPDSIPEDELVLFTGTRGAEAVSPVWHDRSDARFDLIESPTAVRLPDGSVMLMHRRCLNGTGGCMAYPFKLRPEGAVVPLRMTYADQLLDAIPDGWGTRKGIGLDPDGPSLRAGVYVGGDANCCPSFLATSLLRIEDDELVADSVVMAADRGSSAWKVAPGESFGHISAGTSEEELVRRYGVSQVREAEVHLSEGFCSPGTVIYPGTSSQLELVWADSARSRPAFVRTRRRGAPWRTWSGVGPGVSLDSLEALAAGPLELYGFGWDFGGLMKWNEDGRTVTLMLAPVPLDQLTGLSDPRADELWGDRLIRSDHPLLRDMHVEVAEMRLDWARPGVERDCEGPIEGG